MAARPARVTIADVALRANTSVTSVSNLLNGRTTAMSVATAERIRSAVADLGYRPNSAARALVRQRTALLGVMVSEIETGLLVQGISQLEAQARAHGYAVLIASAKTVEDEARGLDLFVEKQTDGIVFLSTSSRRDDSHLDQVADAGVPIVLVNRAGTHDRFDQVSWDNRGGVVSAVDHLVRLGHRRIAHLMGPANRVSTDDRIDGYRAALARHGLAAEDSLVARTDYDGEPQEWAETALQLMRQDDPPTAILAADDIVAGMVMRALADAGYEVPGDVSVIGFDDQPFARYLGLTTVRLPVADAGQAALDLLVKRIADPDRPRDEQTLWCPLVQRTTTAAPRGAR